MTSNRIIALLAGLLIGLAVPAMGLTADLSATIGRQELF
jgi:hypothetical protein